MFNYTLNIIQNLRPLDLLDIVIISVFIYLLLIWFKKARARFILVGVIITASIYVLAKTFNLYLTTRAFQTFFAVFLILIIVIFQDEIRHLFERIAIWGMSPKGRRVVTEGRQRDIDVLNSALVNISHKGIGALIVLQGKDPLDRYLEAGVELNGALSQILLESIFEPHTLSHDGAVIVDGARLVKFGCHLPLSTNTQEIGHLGTRHAAALGLTEHTDALCIVVSEERGTISIAEAGRIRQLGDTAQLRLALQDFYNSRFPERQKGLFTEFLTGHFVEKIIAVLLACGLWLVFGHRTEIIRRDFIVPIEYRNLTNDTLIREPKPKEVNVALNGSERIFNFLKPEELKISLDMSKVKDGENRFRLNKDLFDGYPPGITVVNIEPPEIALEVYRMVPLSIPVEVKTSGRLPSTVTLRQISVYPKEVQVRSDSTIARDKIYLATENIDLRSIEETKTFTPQLILSPGAVFPENKRPEVKLTIEVEKKQEKNDRQ